jgi:hypothetical protein
MSMTDPWDDPESAFDEDHLFTDEELDDFETVEFYEAASDLSEDLYGHVGFHKDAVPHGWNIADDIVDWDSMDYERGD